MKMSLMRELWVLILLQITVVIFYGSKIKSVAYDSLIAITNSKANIEHLKAEKTAKNYLDF